MKREMLQTASARLLYEIQMLNVVVKVLLSGALEKSAAMDVFLESYLTHIKALHYFFYANRSKNERVIVTDYFEHQAEPWPDELRRKSSEMKQIAVRLGKDIFNITCNEVDMATEAREWENSNLLNEFNELFDKVVLMAPQDLLTPELAEYQNS